MPYKEEDFRRWIDMALSNYGRVRSEYDKARDYIENEQSPANVPKDKEYLQKNLLTDMMRRRAGELVSSRIVPAVTGGGEKAKAKKELFFDILEENKFSQAILPTAANFFYSEGFAGLKFADRAKKRSKYGRGFPGIEYLKPGELLLDPDVRDGNHVDDLFRIHAKRIPIAIAHLRYPEHKNEINPSEEISHGQNDTTSYADIYEIEYKETELDSEGMEVEIIYIVKVVNKTLVVEGPEKTGYPVFRLIPMIHTPRHKLAGKYPLGLYGLLKQLQDSINVAMSVTLDSVKASIKQLLWVSGAKPEEEVQINDKLAKTSAVHVSRNSAAKATLFTGNPIPPALVQILSILESAFQDVSGLHSPQKGDPGDRELSGKALNILDISGSIPEITALANVESSLTDLAICIFTYINKHMKESFSIVRPVNGKEQEISFNKVVDQGTPSTRMNFVKGGFINPLDDEGERVKVSVIMNQNERSQLEVNKALLLDERQKIALVDLYKVLYPEDWQEKLDNFRQESSVQALIMDIAETAPEALQQIADVWQNQIKPAIVDAGLDQNRSQ
jgi:hypothetical protein